MELRLGFAILGYMLRNPLQAPVLVKQLYLDFRTRFHKSRIGEYQDYLRPLEDALALVGGERASAVLASAGNLDTFLGEVKGLAAGDKGVIPPEWDADPTLAQFAYYVCRLIQPEAVVETGVAHGITSAFILKALAENGKGYLYSIDLPVFELGSERFVGIAVPERLRNRWTLTLGLSGYYLPSLLTQLGKIDMFLHDSNHSYHNQRFEYTFSSRHLVRGGVLLSDDVNATDAFIEFAEKQGIRPVCVAQPTKSLLIGLLVKP